MTRKRVKPRVTKMSKDERMYHDFVASPAPLSAKHVRMISEQPIPPGYMVTLRLALAVQGKSGKDLVARVADNREHAETAAYLALRVGNLEMYLRELANEVKNARLRLCVSLASREDMVDVIDAAKGMLAADQA